MFKKMILILTLASLSAFISSCESAGKNTAMGTGIGAAAGAGVGAIIGHQTGNRGKGAAIGAVLGGTLGGTLGHRMDKQAKELAKVAETKRTENGIITKLKGDILFSTGSSGVKGPAKSSIQEISGILKKYPENRITIVGHTDSTGSDVTNQKISEARSGAVRTLMVQSGVPAASISAIGAGESTPVATNKTAQGRAMNRRVELQITADPAKVKE